MRAMILAAGLGTRLRPLTDATPKPLLPILWQPMLAHILDHLRRYEVRDVAINLHHRASQLRQWLGDGRQWGMRLHLSHEPEILGTAGGIKQVEAFLGERPFLVINADVLTDLDLRAVWQWHCQHEALVTMVVRPDPMARQFGAVVVDTTDRVLQISGRPSANMLLPGQETIFTGIQVLSPVVLQRIPQGRVASTTVDVYPDLVTETQAVYGYRYAGYWLDAGVPERYLQAHWDMLDGARGYGWLSHLPPGSRVVCHGLPTVPGEPWAKLMPPVVLGAGVTLAPEACVGPYAVLGGGCQVGAGAVIRESIVWEDVHIAARARIHQSILGSGVRIAAASVLNRVVRVV
jgi:NDP-sugar pyrophosphorylase family protein